MEIVLDSRTLEVVNLVVSLLIPVLVAVVTKQYANGRVKSLLLVLLAAAAAVGALVLDTGTFNAFEAVMLFVQNVVVATSVHYGVLKPTGVTGSEGTVAHLTPRFGFGAQKDSGQGRRAA